MKLHYLGMVAAVGLLAACSTPATTTKTDTGSGISTAPTSTTSGSSSSSVTPGSEADFAQNVGDRVFFQFNKSGLTPDATKVLGGWVAFLKKNPSDKVSIAGDCDERGTEEYNLALGARRSNAVKSFLVAQGIDASRITATSNGKLKPVATGHDEASYAQNRNAIGTIQ